MAVKPQLILASQSPRRKQLLQWAELSFECIAPNIDETYPSQLNSKEVAQYIARKKAQAANSLVQQQFPQQPPVVLAADTIVHFQNKIIGKPKNKAEALHILKTLSGNKHEVITGVCLQQQNEEISFSETTYVSFHTLTAQQIEHYVDTYQPYDKAGAYAIQEWIGVIGIEYIEGDFYNVMGLPVSKVLKALRHFNI